MARPPTIYVDADACPVREEVLKVAERHETPVVMVSNGGIRPSRDPMVRNVVVGAGADAADDWIVENAQATDIVITADVPLASRVVALGAVALSPSGRPFTAETVGMALAMRNLRKHLRETGEDRGFNAAFSPKARSAFLQALDAALRRAKSAPVTREPIGRTAYFALSLAASAAAGLAALFIQPDFTLDAAALGLFGTYLACALWNLPLLTADYLRGHARQEDLPATFMFAVVLLVVATCVGSLFQLINSKGDPDPVRLVLALGSVAAAWLTIHTMYAFHYAHLCWLDDDVSDARADTTPREKAQGLSFPGDDQPGGLDFLYFSFVIGMTAQTADVDTTSTRLRRIVLVHSVLAYLFNTVIVAAAVNLAVSLGQ